MVRNIIIPTIILLNPWVLRILNTNILLGLVVIFACLFFYISVSIKSKKFKVITLFFLAILLFVQYKTTQADDLYSLTSDEQRVQSEQVLSYSPIHISFFSKNIWINAEDFLEKEPKLIAFRRMQNNFFENLDINLYFFANHPRERVGFNEFEKFPYMLLPLLLAGSVIAFNNKSKFLFISFLFPLLISTYMGNKNINGPFSLIPVLVVVMLLGTKVIPKNKWIKFTFLFLLLLNLAQIFIYETL